MKTALSRNLPPGRNGVTQRAGVTLIEVLVAIYITGVGLLALLELFPLGALDLARTIKDDRTAKFARDAAALSEAGEELISRTGDFVQDAWSEKTDSETVEELRAEYQDLAEAAATLEFQLRELRLSLPDPKARRKVDLLLSEIRSIKRGLSTLAMLFGILEDGP